MKKYICKVILLFIAGCMPLHIRQSVRMGPEDWTLYGGSIGRTNVARSLVPPPLTVVWEYEMSAGFSGYSGVAADSFLFVGDLHGEVHAIKITNGKAVGVSSFGSAIVGSPVIDDDRIFVALTKDEESLICYRLSTGTVEWRAALGEIETSPLLIDKRLYVTTLAGALICLEKASGTIVWKYELPIRTKLARIYSSPASDGMVIVFGCDDGSVYAINAEDGTLRWKMPTRKSVVASPSISSDKVFIGSLDSTYYAFDLQTGNIAWKQNLGSKIYASQAVDSHYVYTATASGSIVCLNAMTGAIAWRVETNSVINSSPILSGNVLYIGSINKTFSAYQAETGKLLWQYKAEGRIKTTPVIFKEYLFLLTEDRTVIAFKHTEQQ